MKAELSTATPSGATCARGSRKTSGTTTRSPISAATGHWMKYPGPAVPSLPEFATVCVQKACEARILSLVGWREFASFDNVRCDQAMIRVRARLLPTAPDDVPAPDEATKEALLDLP